jgi:hypothetical protein
MNRPDIGNVMNLAVMAALLLIGCVPESGTNPDGPAFADLKKLGDNKTYVAYPFPDPWKKKLDTLTLTFECNPSKINSISIAATIDSGKTWIPVTSVSAPFSKNLSVYWVPKNSSMVPKYFGIRRCFIHIADTTTDAFIDSDTFPLVGAASIVLLDSLDRSVFKTTDTINVRYGANMDLASNIQTYFKTDSMDNWVEFVNDSRLPSPDAPIIVNRQKRLVLSAVDSMVKIEAKNFTQPIRILLRDYGAADCLIMTGNIVIVP